MLAKRLLAVVGLVLVAVAPATAQTTETVRYAGYNYAYAGYAVGAYDFTVPYPGGATLDAYCVDAAHTVRTDAYTAYFSPLSGDLGFTRLGNTGYTTYLQAAYLATRFSIATTNAERAYIHAAIWYITSPTGTTPWGDPYGSFSLGNAGAVQSWITTAQANYQSMESQAQYWQVMSDADGRGQEFLVHVTPEPEVWFMLATGLIGLLGAGALRGRFLV